MDTKNEYLEENTFEYLKKKKNNKRSEGEGNNQARQEKVNVKFVPVP